jgi:hypothetical protein
MSPDMVGVFAQYGVVGIMLLAVGVFAKTMITREQVRADRLESEVTRLNTLVQEKTIPALVSATQAIQGSQELLQRMQYQRDVANRTSEQKGERL